MKRRLTMGCGGTLAAAVLVAVVATAFVYLQARRTPEGEPEYVSLGSSFAAGAGLGKLQENSPLMCARSVNGYPQRLARKLGLSIVDMSCGGAVTQHVVDGGQFFQGPQVRVIGPRTKLVTITVGGNDVGYSRDLGLLASRNTGSFFGRLVAHFWGGPDNMAERDFTQLQHDVIRVVETVRRRAPGTKVVIATYPAILPPKGTCPVLALDAEEAETMREVGDRLAATTRSAARKSGAMVVDMHELGAAHNACSAEPWTNGWTNGGIAPFHPTPRGAEATANAIFKAVGRLPAGVAAVREDNAAGH